MRTAGRLILVRPVIGIELGGTKSVAVLGRADAIVDRIEVPTTTPDETLGTLREVVAEWRTASGATAVAVASFGPVAIDPSDPDYGRMLPTPKVSWSGADVLGILADGFAHHTIHTDVTAAAIGEGRLGAARGLDDHVYVTVGTGIGMGIVVGGRPVGGAMHPEGGHVRVPRVRGDGFRGNCPFHDDCLEGLASGPAIAARAGRPAHLLPPDDPAWPFVADALAESFAALFLTLGTRRIVVGGGVVLGQPHLLHRVRPLVLNRLGGYLPHLTPATVEAAIVPAALGAMAGPVGALAMAADLLD